MAGTLDVVLDDDFDIQIDSDGDILTNDSLDTSILMSLFCEKRANSSEVPVSSLRRGWIGNESTPGFEIGSKLWLYSQSRVTRTTLVSIQNAARDGLQWLVDDNIAVEINVVATLSNSKIILEISILRPNSKVDKRYYDLWENTGN